jgi:hypothetical protein
MLQHTHKILRIQTTYERLKDMAEEEEERKENAKTETENGIH